MTLFQRSLLHTHSDNQSGFSLIELSVVLVVIGLLMGAAVSLVRPYVDSYRYATTKQKMEKIADALAIYAQNHYDVPCPAARVPTTEPFGSPINSGADGIITDAKCAMFSGAAVRHGIVPFRILGLDENQVKDAYGNFITYTIPQGLDRYKANSDRTEVVYFNCRTDRWIDPVTSRNYNYKKARFCCPVPPANSLLLVLDGNYTRATSRNMFVRDTNMYAAQVGSPDTITAANVASASVPEIIMFALISHGKNQVGAWMPNGSRRPRPSVLPAYSDDGGNANENDRRLVQKPMNTTLGMDYFDDIMIYRTNHQLMSAFHNNSCARP